MSIPTAIGLDHGDARIGVAAADSLGMLAHPLETIPAKDAPAALARIVEIIAERKAQVVVLGMPRNMDGSHGPAADKVRAFAAQLQERAPGCQIRFIDERMTTMAAQKALHASGRNVKKGRSVIDQVSAQMILQVWLDQQAMLAG